MAQGPQPPPPSPTSPLILGKKEEIRKERKANRASKTKLGPPLSSRSGSATDY